MLSEALQQLPRTTILSLIKVVVAAVAMSGFEIAGLIIGTIPLVVTAVEAYISFMKDWGKTTSELRSINRQLTTERAKLYNVLEQLLGDIVSQEDVEPMLEDPFGPSWKTDQANSGIRRRLRDSYGPFEQTVLEVQEALVDVMGRLSVEVTPDGKASPPCQLINGGSERLTWQLNTGGMDEETLDAS